jgi:hypothetical protein
MRRNAPAPALAGMLQDTLDDIDAIAAAQGPMDMEGEMRVLRSHQRTAAVDQHALSLRTDAVEKGAREKQAMLEQQLVLVSALCDRLSTLEGDVGALKSRAAATESVLAEHEARAVATESQLAEHEGQIVALREQQRDRLVIGFTRRDTTRRASPYVEAEAGGAVAQLTEALWPTGFDAFVPGVAILTGLGGAGKTSAAVEYSYRAAGRYPGRIAELNADGEAFLLELRAFVTAELGMKLDEKLAATSLVQQVKVSVSRPFSDMRIHPAEVDRRLAHGLQAQLNSYAPGRPWLLILDNADSPGEVADLVAGLAGAGGAMRGHMVLTTRKGPDAARRELRLSSLPSQPIPGECQCRIIVRGAMDEDTSFRLLTESMRALLRAQPLDLYEEEELLVRTLVGPEMLAGLPLALSIAAGTLTKVRRNSEVLPEGLLPWVRVLRDYIGDIRRLDAGEANGEDWGEGTAGVGPPAEDPEPALEEAMQEVDLSEKDRKALREAAASVQELRLLAEAGRLGAGEGKEGLPAGKVLRLEKWLAELDARKQRRVREAEEQARRRSAAERRSLHSAWLISYRMVANDEEHGPAALHALHAASLLFPQAVPVHVLRPGRRWICWKPSLWGRSVRMRRDGCSSRCTGSCRPVCAVRWISRVAS